MRHYIIDIKTRDSEDYGSLSFVEANRDVEFSFKRCYYIYGVSAGVQRGFHAHKTLKQLLFCPYGSVKMVLDDGNSREEIVLDNPSKGLVLEGAVWREMHWQKDNSTLCVLTDGYYDERDYIRDYKTFQTYVSEGLE